jgi:predicted secreted hydrolase
MLPPLSLPADELPHSFFAEWWYVNGHLVSDSGNAYGLHYVIFQVQEPITGRPIYVGQLGFTDLKSGSHVTEEAVSNIPAVVSGDRFDLRVGTWEMQGDGRTYRLVAQTEDVSFDLDLTVQSPAMLHDRDGLVDFQQAGVSYYYSRPRLDVKGLVTTADGAEHVTGLAWLDKQWGNFLPIAVSWDWTSINLDDGTDVMLSVVKDSEGEEFLKYGTLAKKDGSVRYLNAQEFQFIAGADTWESAETGGTYPVAWEVSVPDEGINLRLEALVPASEFISQSFKNVYWEGAMTVTGTFGTNEVTGQAFVELTGRAQVP